MKYLADMKNAKYLDKNGFFVGNHQFNIHDEIKYLFKILNE
jgi:CDP-6-deoxy-D-xylo-4-hexulose-3-dehydrase